ncbi:hypothetical protein [Bradyrhizobium uaiense]|uniref:Uncharacterized protein n=1 Tax=Bradyrhizobium uaiense TaxID=2594946 RepID=A0A6P1B8X3_9BRAD|nr:hypothetical protein [Bradyrhizobium uaiense]NEU94829.1 hypothetical protein [Bradyrhizobium uaiense]
MFSALEAIGAAWRTVAHISAWSGLSLGALAACGALFYFDPLARRVAIAGAGVVLVGWVCLIHGHSVGAADERARLQTLSDHADARAATAASADEKALVSAIESKAKDQHDADLAEIARLKAAGASCAFDPDGDASGLRAQPGDAGASTAGGKAKSAGNAAPPDKGTPGAASGRRVLFPLVPRSWLPGKGHHGDAAADGQR